MIEMCKVLECLYKARCRGFCLHCYHDIFYTYHRQNGKNMLLKNLVLDEEGNEI